jgi:transposase
MKSQEGRGQARRRHHEQAFKTRLIEEGLKPGASVSAIAMESGINANLLFKWLRDHRRASKPVNATGTVLLPVRVTQAGEADVGPSSRSPSVAPPVAHSTRSGVIELEIAGAQLRLRGSVDEASLCSVLRALRQSA